MNGCLMKHNLWPPYLAGGMAAQLIRRPAVACLVAGVLVLAAGCASNEGGRAGSKPGDGIAEYRQIATGAEEAIRTALKHLDQVRAQSNACPAEVLAAFSAEVNHLQVESVQVRARGQAIQERGDAYFERWHENMAQVKDPRLRTLAEERRPQLQESFRRIKSLSQESREAFKPFLSELRQMRNALEKDPASVGASTTQELARSARQNGNQVVKCIAGVTRELDTMKAMLGLGSTAKEKGD